MLTNSITIFCLSTVSTILALSGNILINHKKILGFYIWCISNILWILVNILGQPNYPQIIMYIAYFIINIIGIIRWKKGEKIDENNNVVS